MSNEFSGTEQLVVPGVLRGYREWRIVPGGLRALHFNHIWRPGINRAKCGKGGILTYPHSAPRASCTCGFYARHKPFVGAAVLGSIKASGRVILGTEGFRAECVEIEAFCIGAYWHAQGWLSSDALKIIQSYEVPIYSTMDELLQSFPPISVEHLLPKPEPTPGDLRFPSELERHPREMQRNYETDIKLEDFLQ